MKRVLSRRLVLIVLLLGAGVRVALLGMAGDEVAPTYRLWGTNALEHGLVHAYIAKDTDVLKTFFLRRQGITPQTHFRADTELGPTSVPDYPPGSLVFLEWGIGLCRFLQHGHLHSGWLLNACANLPAFLLSLATAIAILRFVQKEKLPNPLRALTGFWLNPAILLLAPILGFQDPIFAFFAWVSLVALFRRKFLASAIWLAVACMIKPQGIFLIPVVPFVVWADGGWSGALKWGSRFCLSVLLMILPFALAGDLLAWFGVTLLDVKVSFVATQPMNPWWLALPAVRTFQTLTLKPWSGLIGGVSGEAFKAAAGMDPLWLSYAGLALFTLANLYFLRGHLRAGNRYAIFWAAGMEVYLYSMLAVGVWGNHPYSFFVYAAPLLALGKKSHLWLYWMLSGVWGLAFYFIDGLGSAIPFGAEKVRMFFGFDLSIMVALISIAIFLRVVSTRHWMFDDSVPSSSGNA
jgi:hypothetical protein